MKQWLRAPALESLWLEHQCQLHDLEQPKPQLLHVVFVIKREMQLQVHDTEYRPSKC